MQLNGINVKNILFIDIETVPIEYQFENLGEDLKKALITTFQKEIEREKEKYPHLTTTILDLYNKQGGIKSEYSKIICIGLAFIYDNPEHSKYELHCKTIGCKSGNETEKDILEEFRTLIETKYSNIELIFCGHNINEFDMPFISRRMLVNGISIPKKMNYQNKKPWEIKNLDTMKLWSFGDRKNYTSLELLCAILNIPTSKQELRGDKIKDAFYVAKEFEKIARYCIADVVAIAQVLLKMNGQSILEENQIIYKICV